MFDILEIRCEVYIGKDFTKLSEKFANPKSERIIKTKRSKTNFESPTKILYLVWKNFTNDVQNTEVYSINKKLGF